jgi:hypothetical protein
MMGALRVAIQLSEPRFKPNIHFDLGWRGGQGKVSKRIPVNTSGRAGRMGDPGVSDKDVCDGSRQKMGTGWRRSFHSKMTNSCGMIGQENYLEMQSISQSLRLEKALLEPRSRTMAEEQVLSLLLSTTIPQTTWSQNL